VLDLGSPASATGSARAGYRDVPNAVVLHSRCDEPGDRAEAVAARQRHAEAGTHPVDVLLVVDSDNAPRTGPLPGSRRSRRTRRCRARCAPRSDPRRAAEGGSRGRVRCPACRSRAQGRRCEITAEPTRGRSRRPPPTRRWRPPAPQATSQGSARPGRSRLHRLTAPPPVALMGGSQPSQAFRAGGCDRPHVRSPAMNRGPHGRPFVARACRFFECQPRAAGR
jgi:hypothetical protein